MIVLVQGFLLKTSVIFLQVRRGDDGGNFEGAWGGQLESKAGSHGGGTRLIFCQFSLLPKSGELEIVWDGHDTNSADGCSYLQETGS